MGLDMYLKGSKHVRPDYKNPENNPKLDGFDLDEYRLELGYWRKHPNLHGYIVTEFAGGVDECQEIELTEEALQKILHATEVKALPKTEGFFFGESRPEDDPATIDIIRKALAWLRLGEKGFYKSVTYHASW